jgi:hypothetical protein
MNAALKTRLSNIVTVMVSIIPAIQTSLSSPPLTQHNVVIAGGVLALLSIVFTSAKQWLSAEVNSMAWKVTLVVSAIPIITAFGNLVNLFQFSDAFKASINWWISLLAMIVTIISKQLFPSEFQKDKVQELKTIDPVKTQ